MNKVIWQPNERKTKTKPIRIRSEFHYLMPGMAIDKPKERGK